MPKIHILLQATFPNIMFCILFSPFCILSPNTHIIVPFIWLKSRITELEKVLNLKNSQVSVWIWFHDFELGEQQPISPLLNPCVKLQDAAALLRMGYGSLQFSIAQFSTFPHQFALIKISSHKIYLHFSENLSLHTFS